MKKTTLELLSLTKKNKQEPINEGSQLGYSKMYVEGTLYP
jgi:hypothetical protein